MSSHPVTPIFLKGVHYTVLCEQEFMRVYEVLREELMADDLIAGQPSFSAEYMKKVSVPDTP